MIIRFKFCQKWVSKNSNKWIQTSESATLHTVRVGVWLSPVITQDVICTHKNFTSQYK